MDPDAANDAVIEEEKTYSSGKGKGRLSMLIVLSVVASVFNWLN